MSVYHDFGKILVLVFNFIRASKITCFQCITLCFCSTRCKFQLTSLFIRLLIHGQCHRGITRMREDEKNTSNYFLFSLFHHLPAGCRHHLKTYPKSPFFLQYSSFSSLEIHSCETWETSTMIFLRDKPVGVKLILWEVWVPFLKPKLDSCTFTLRNL